MNELVDFRARATAAMRRALRPDLRAIYAGDGDALERLAEKISLAEARQVRMKATNAAIRRSAKQGQAAQIAALLAMGYKDVVARELLEPDFCGRIGFADFELTNHGANIRRLKARFEQITRLHATPAAQLEGKNARVEEVPAENRVRLFFPGKPEEAIRSRLKSSGFRWTHSLGCWQAYFGHTACQTAKEIAGVQP